MWALTSLIVRLVLSLAVTTGFAVVSESGPNIGEFLLFWIMIYVFVSMYYHIRRGLNESDKYDPETYKWLRKIRYERKHPLFDMVLEYLVLPFGFIALALVVLPEWISGFFPEGWQETVHMILGAMELLGVIVYDIWKVKEAYDIGELSFDTHSFKGILCSLVKPLLIFFVLGLLAFSVVVFIDQELGGGRLFKKDNSLEKKLEKYEDSDSWDELEKDIEEALAEQSGSEKIDQEFLDEKEFSDSDAMEPEQEYMSIDEFIKGIGEMELKLAAEQVRYVETEEVTLVALYDMEQKDGAVSSEYIPELCEKGLLAVAKYINQLTGKEAYGYCVFYEPSIDEANVSFYWESKYTRLEISQGDIQNMLEKDTAYIFTER